MPAWDFDSIYEAHSRMVYWTAYGIVKSQNDAMDISQNVFLRVIKHMDKLEDMGEAQLKSWLYRVTVNLCIDMKRMQKREVAVEEFYEEEELDTSMLPEAAALTGEQRDMVHKAIDALPDIYRETVVQHYFAGLNYEEIARITGVSEGTVKSRMFRAKEKMMSFLKEGGMCG